ncbi:MAG: branched-chain amino acid ABC transporter permease [Flavobacteriaceae bacterium]
MSAYILQLTVNALQVSVFYALVAVAYVLFHGVTNRFNLAFGAMVMLAGYSVIGLTAGLLVRGMDARLALAAACCWAAALSALAGGWLTRTVYRPAMAGTPLAMMIATIGVAIVMEEIARLAADSREMWLEPLLTRRREIAAQVYLTDMQVATIAAAGLGVALLWYLIEKRPFGRLWRAVSQDAGMAALLGVDGTRVLYATGILSAAAAGFAGALIGLAYGNASYHTGIFIGSKALLVAIIGGMRSIPLVVAGAFALGLFESFWTGFLPGTWRDVASFAVLAAFLVLLNPRESRV